MTSQQVAIITEKVSLHQRQTDHLIGQISARHEAMFAMLCEKLEEAPETLNSLTRMLGNSGEANIETSNTLATTSREHSRDLHRPIDTGPCLAPPNELRMHILQGINTSRKSCHCTCHLFREAAIPGIWSLAVRDLRLPYVRASCNTGSCKCRAASCIRIKYYLPTWIAYRMISIWFRSSALDGPQTQTTATMWTVIILCVLLVIVFLFEELEAAARNADVRRMRGQLDWEKKRARDLDCNVGSYEGGSRLSGRAFGWLGSGIPVT